MEKDQNKQTINNTVEYIAQKEWIILFTYTSSKEKAVMVQILYAPLKLTLQTVLQSYSSHTLQWWIKSPLKILHFLQTLFSSLNFFFSSLERLFQWLYCFFLSSLLGYDDVYIPMNHDLKVKMQRNVKKMVVVASSILLSLNLNGILLK
jgi:hypothetical protein